MKKIITLMALVLMTAGATATEIWTGTCVIGDWSGSSVTVEKGAFESAATGNIIKVTFSAYATTTGGDSPTEVTYWQYSLGQKDNDWTELTNFSGGDLTRGQKSASYTLTETNVTELKNYGLSVNGRYVTVTKVELLTTETPIILFSGSSATGDWETNVTWSSDEDKAKLAAVQLNDYIKMTYTVTLSGAQAAIQTAWNSVAAKDDNSYVAEGDNTGKTLTLTIDDAATLEKIQQNNIQVRGKNITITAVEHIKASNRYDAVPLTIGSDGICTYGSSKNLDFSTLDGVTPYYASATTTGLVTLTAVSTTRAWAGYVVRGTAGTYNVPVAASDPEWINAFHNLRYSGDYDGNWVYRSAYSDYTGTDDNATKIKTYYRYILAKDKSSNIGFYKLATDYSRTTTEKEGDIESGASVYYHILAAHKAYLETDKDITPAGETSAPVLLQFLDGDVTGVKAICDLPVSDLQYGANGCYDLSGRKVDSKSVNGKLRKGIYIVNGRKVVVK